MNPEQQEAFDKFWKEHWPKCRRIDKKKAADQWSKIPAELYPAIFAAVERQKKQPSWNKDNCAYIPYPHRWLRDKRWEDEVALPEDEDAEKLIEALQLHSSKPGDFPERIWKRGRSMFERMRWNWPLLHAWFHMSPAETASKVRAAYIATPENPLE